jgi:hypothetical protein
MEEEFCDIVTKILDSKLSDSNYMNGMELCFKLTTFEKENTVLEIIFTVFDEYIEKIKKDCESTLERSKFISENKITNVPTVNELISIQLKKDAKTELENMLEKYKTAATTTQRISSYIHRFYIRNQQNQGNVFNFKTHKIRYNDLSEMLMEYLQKLMHECKIN